MSNDHTLYNRWNAVDHRSSTIRYTPMLSIVDHTTINCLDRPITNQDVLYNKLFKL